MSISLTAEQERVVYSNTPKIVVAAAAGSGKTKSLTERIGRLIQDGVDPIGIVAITFTRMAADEMKERLRHIPGTEDAFIGTIHAFAHKVLKVSGDDFTILNDDTDLELHQYLIETYCKKLTHKDYLRYRDVRAKVELGLMAESRLDGILAPSAQDELRRIERTEGQDKLFPETMASLCKARNIIDFNELLERTIAFFQNTNADIDHVLVDEFQDVGNLQYQFVMSLKAHNYFLIGDDYQAIYGWNGGNSDIFKGLMRAGGEWERHMLTQNWRSAPQIVQEAGEIIAQVPDRIEKVIQVMRETDGEVIWGEMEEMKYLIEDIKGSKQYRDWFFLTRTNKDLQLVSTMLKAKGVPHDTFRRAGLSLSDVRKDMEKNTVKLMTVHMAKGLEAPNVLMYGKTFFRRAPSYRNSIEERQVMYVGMTRARDNLVILNR